MVSPRSSQASAACSAPAAAALNVQCVSWQGPGVRSVSLAVVLGFQDAPFPLPAAARFVEPEEPKLQHPVVCTLQALPSLSSERTCCARQRSTMLRAPPLLFHALCAYMQLV